MKPSRIPKWCLLHWSSPSVIEVQVANKSLSFSLYGVSVPAHAFSGETHSCQSQRRRRAVASLLRSRMPRPPCSFISVVLFQLTLHFPPEISLSPAHY
jgi:hypothetical protein